MKTHNLQSGLHFRQGERTLKVKPTRPGITARSWIILTMEKPA